ncbi:Urease accessory protein UreF [Rhodobacterales bacterium HTCC2150]|nr:Urease accessory protein UreF [Rhodobacterales bacterium HTCC2150] [Rhodobacteraceae bacterium HTCC2150]
MSFSAQHKLMAWLSPSYPIGAFSYSHGLEHAIENGDVINAAHLRDWLADVLQFGSGRNDAILLSLAYKAQTDDRLSELTELTEALCPSAERYLETTAQGRAFCKVTSDVYGTDLPSLSLPVAIGAAASDEGMDLADVLPLYLHSFVANIISAGVRFIPIGQTEGQKVLYELFDVIEDVAKAAMTSNETELGSACFLGDIASMKHAVMTTRIFRT